MAQRITWANKTTSKTVNVPADQKMSAADYNQIKTALNAHASDIESLQSSISSFAASIVTLVTTNFDVLTGANVQAVVEEIDEALLNGASTGIRDGGVVTFGAASVTISAGAGEIIDNTDALNPVYYALSWDQQVDVALEQTSPETTYFYFDNTGVLRQSTQKPTRVQRRTRLYVGATVYSSAQNQIISAIEERDLVQQVGQQVRDVASIIGLARLNGMVIQPNGANLSLNITSGELFDFGAGVSEIDPHFQNISQDLGFTFQLETRNQTVGSVTSIDPTQYDNGGTLTAVPNNRFTVQRVYIFSNGLKATQYGQATFTSLSAAEQAIATSSYVENPNNSEGFRAAFIIVREDVTDLAAAIAAGTAKIITTNRFGEIGGGAALAGSGFLEASNNLSDLVDAAAARGNLNVASKDGNESVRQFLPISVTLTASQVNLPNEPNSKILLDTATSNIQITINDTDAAANQPGYDYDFFVVDGTNPADFVFQQNQTLISRNGWNTLDGEGAEAHLLYLGGNQWFLYGDIKA